MKETKTVHADKSIAQKIEKITQGLVGRIGVAAQDLSSGLNVSINGDETFCMASAYKVAIASKVMDLVDKGELSLDQMVDVPHEMYDAGEVAIAERFPYPGVKFSLANLIYPMITESDNTATDVCMGLAGGPAAVTENLRRLGIKDFRVDRTVREILMDFYSLPSVTPEAVVEAIG
ncbi:serine hydrolase, partial [Eudoraea sp.]|uniref:serine hydrolase n=2 Tax=Eudoraea sp. TaxID=1979955 RepID=UPI003C779071